jgi:putative colanic acid biosynthesis UDP-glucose lipid carrier transferase
VTDRENQSAPLLDVLAAVLARIFDFSWLLLAAVIAYWLRFENFTAPITYQAASLLGTLLVVMAYSVLQIYTSWRGRHKMQLLALMIAGHLLGFAALMGMLVLSHQAIALSRKWMSAWFVLGFIGVIGFRVIVYWFLNRLRTQGMNIKQVVLVGTEQSVNKMVTNLNAKPWMGLKVCWAVLIAPPVGQLKLAAHQWSLSLDNLVEKVDEHDARDVWICLPLKEEDTMNRVLYAMRHHTANIRYFPDFSGFNLIQHKTTTIAGMPALDLSCSALDGINWVTKNIVDRLLGLIIFVMISPLLLMIALSIKLTSPGPILFKQYRHGIDGRRINIYKFRSMKMHTESEGIVTQASKTDSRITPLGAFLRRTSLDELPQFFNVIQGKMSIVGPRPHAMAHNEFYKEEIAYYMQRHKVKPGITGWAQINGFRGETDTIEKMRKRIEYDLFYIENWSLALDFKIIFMTILKGFVHKNAY